MNKTIKDKLLEEVTVPSWYLLFKDKMQLLIIIIMSIVIS